MDIFQRASKVKLRFETVKGNLSTEDLWDLPLKSSRKVSLNSIAKIYHKLLKEDVECDFVDSGTKDPEYTANKLRFDVVLTVIEFKKEAIKKAESIAANKERKLKIIEAIENKKDNALQNLSVEELEAELKAL